MPREGEAGARVADLCRKYAMSDASYYDSRARYAGLTVSDVRRLKALEAENRRLKQVVLNRSWAECKEGLPAGRHGTGKLRLPASDG